MDKRIAGILYDLWETYKIDCPYAQRTIDLFRPIVNDHIAFRSVRTGYDTGGDYSKKTWGIGPIEAMWNELGWKRHAQYNIEDKNIYAIHMEPPEKDLPKIFISEFMTEKLDKEDRAFVNNIFCKPREIVFGGEDLSKLSQDAFYEFFHTSLYPESINVDDLMRLNSIDQYLAWVRLFGRKPNHFTLLVNPIHNTNIEMVYHDMANAKIPMKDEIEGEGTELAQTSTEPYKKHVPVTNDSLGFHYIDWPYAYYEVIERGMTRFEGFKVNQTKALFDMTKKEVIDG